MAPMGYISLTEVPQFRRLVTFLADVESLAQASNDDSLRKLIDEVRRDLIDLREQSK